MINISGYQTVDVIHDDANSLVIRALRESDSRPVVLKMLKGDYPTPLETMRYRQEFEITKDLAVEGVVKTYGLETHQNKPVIITEDFGGESLSGLAGATGFTLEKFLETSIEVVEILGRIHAADVIHKDVNPSNIVMNPKTGRIKIIDFGISTVLPRENLGVENAGALEGTLAYISPEQTGRMNRSLDYRTDYYSLGVAFYELLTGRLPFDAADPMEWVHCHIAKTPVPLHELDRKIPRVVSDIVDRLLSKNAEDRYQSSFGIAADLKECLGQWRKRQRIDDFPIGSRDVSSRFQIPEKLYGREKEIENLLAAFGGISRFADNETDEVPSRKVGMMLVSGRSGIGKTALVQEILKAVTRRRGYYISGKFDLLQRSTPYLALITAISDLARQLLAETEEQLAMWRLKIETALGQNGRVLNDVIPELKLIIGKQPPVPDLPAEESQNRFNLVFLNFIQVFIQQDCPLVIFLDDLQWVDEASLKLTGLFLSLRDPNLLLIGTYRDNEVDATHPLSLVLDDFKNEGAVIDTIKISPLTSVDVSPLVCDTFRCDVEKGNALAELLQQKTNGNPFFIKELLKTLYNRKLIDFDFQAGVWRWSLEEIGRVDISSNVVDLMTDGIQELEMETRQALKLAACMGSRFEANSLARVAETSTMEMNRHLRPAMIAGLILPMSNAYRLIGIDDQAKAEFKFSHDRIRQAAYSMIPTEQKPIIHRRIGLLLKMGSTLEDLYEQIFEVVNHLNQGIDAVENKEERDGLAEMNFEAGKRAKVSGAFKPAFDYFSTGIKLLGERCWEEQRQLTRTLHLEAAETACLCGDLACSSKWVQLVLKHAETVLDQVKAYEIEIKACLAADQITEAITTGLRILKLLGLTLPAKPKEWDVAKAFVQLRVFLAGKRIEDIIDRPDISDATAKAIIDILGRLNHIAYYADPNLFSLTVFHGIRLSLKKGYRLPYNFVGYGMILCATIANIDAGYRIAHMGLEKINEAENRESKAYMLHIFYMMVSPWKQHVKKSLKPLLEAYQCGLETGDLEYAAQSVVQHLTYSYFSGMELTALENKIASFSESIALRNQSRSLDHLHSLKQIVLNLRGQSENVGELIGEAWDEREALSFYEERNLGVAIFILYFTKMYLYYLAGDYPAARKYAIEAEAYIETAMGLLQYSLFFFFDSLILLAIFPSASEREQRPFHKKVAANQKKMRKWADHAPENFLHKFKLVEAESFRVSGKDAEARESYDEAIALAQKHEYINEEALANKLAAQFHFSRGVSHLVGFYLKNAHFAYQHWGATELVHQLEESYPSLLSDPNPWRRSLTATDGVRSFSTGSRTGGDASALDLNSVMKASRAISSEIMLARLLKKMMTIAIENSGADRGLLIMENGGRLRVEAEGRVGGDDVTVLQSLPIEDYGKNEGLPLEIVLYVARTREEVVLENACQKGRYTNDPYVVEKGLKSAACAPILSKNKTVGILYLENSLNVGVFTPDRLQLLGLLSSQAAISIENARMYEELGSLNRNLEFKVEERTQELNVSLNEVEKANRKIMDSIQYATLIQQSLLPSSDDLGRFLSDSFIVWEPRDVVGGDILFMDAFPDGFVVAVVDCTGHGVPGAFMTMIASSGLRRIVKDEGCRDPALILKKLNFMVKTTLHQDTDKALSDDGLDAAICLVETQKEKRMTFAGAKLPLIRVFNGETTVFKGDRQSIGYKKSKRSDIDFDFTNHQFPLQKGMSFYLITDGFTDQLGGSQKRKICFGNKRLLKLLKEQADQPLVKQGETLLQALADHQGEEERKDDLTMIGFKTSYS